MFSLTAVSQNCSSINSTILDPHVVYKGIFKVIFVSVGLLNLALNSASFLVFLCHRQKEPIVRLLMLFLSATEVLASFGMTSVEAVRLLTEILRDRVYYPSYPVAKATIAYLSVAWVMANSFLMARNWCIVLIAVTRCEVVLRPFSRNVGRVCSKRAVTGAFIGMLLLSFTFGLPKAFQEKFSHCLDTGRIFEATRVEPFRHYPEFYLVSAFFQAILPIVIVGFVSVAMTIGLRRRSSGQAATATAHQCCADGHLVMSPSSQMRRNRATRMVQLLLIAFVSLEMPMFLTVMVGIRLPDESEFWDVFMAYAMEVTNLCVNLDSTCNFFIYMKTNSTFRQVILRRRGAVLNATSQFRMSQSGAMMSRRVHQLSHHRNSSCQSRLVDDLHRPFVFREEAEPFVPEADRVVQLD